MGKRRNTINDFFSQVEPVTESGCHIWTGKTTRKGYGIFSYQGKTYPAHRFIWELRRGKFPQGLVTDHLCRVRCCVNLDHLEAVTNAENIRRGTCPTAINKRKTHCNRGHELTPDNVRTRLNRPGERQCKKCHYITSTAYNKRYLVGNRHPTMEDV